MLKDMVISSSSGGNLLGFYTVMIIMSNAFVLLCMPDFINIAHGVMFTCNKKWYTVCGNSVI